MKIISGGQTGVDRAALDAAMDRGIAYGGWCPRGGWAEDFPHPPGVRANYPLLKETPLTETAQRTEWNVRDADATMIVVDGGGLQLSKGTSLARDCAQQYSKPLLVIDLDQDGAVARAVAWLQGQRASYDPGMTLGIGGARESEAPGIQAKAKTFIGAVLDGVATLPNADPLRRS